MPVKAHTYDTAPMLLFVNYYINACYNLTMSEEIQTRREKMSEQVEQSPKHQAMRVLLELGICKKVSDLELYHGRAGNGGKWMVDPSFNNSGNYMGTNNINKVAALNTSENQATAKEFADARSRTSGGIPETRRIISDDPDAMIICSRLSDLNEEDRERAIDAIRQIRPRVMKGAPIRFEDREDIKKISPQDLLDKEYGLMFGDRVSDIEKQTKLYNRDLIIHIGSALNTARLLDSGHLDALCQAFLDDKRELRVGSHTIPINHEYMANLFRAGHIVGSKVRVSSATIGKEIDNYLLFDLAKVNTPEAIERKTRKRNRLFGQIAIASSEKNKNRSNLQHVLESNLYIKPQEIIELARKTPGFEDIFDEDCGNWEGFSLGEHTETTLELFDTNYADLLPASALPLIRLSLLVHDVGKPQAVKRGNKERQKQYNAVFAERFMRRNRVDDATMRLVLSVIGEGMSITSELIRGGGNMVTRWRLRCFSEKIAKEYLGVKRVDKDTVIGFENLLKVIQTCDSAAYTIMAVTTNEGRINYRNYGSFDPSFEQFKGFTGRRARLRRGLS
jgi:hypothetical protein